MTTLFAKKIILTCDNCCQDWIFPNELCCPHCGEGVAFKPLESLDETGNSFYTTFYGERQKTCHRGAEPDRWSKRLVYCGIPLALLIVALGYWDRLLLVPVLEAMKIPWMLHPVFRLVFILGGAFAVLRGVVSLLTWYSGYHFYRNFRF